MDDPALEGVREGPVCVKTPHDDHDDPKDDAEEDHHEIHDGRLVLQVNFSRSWQN